MRILFVKMLCVAVFFMGLGAAVGQIAERLKSDERVLALLQTIGVGEETNSVRKFTVIEKPGARITIEQRKAEASFDNFKIRVPLQNQFEKTCVFPRLPGSEPLKQSGQLRRSERRNLIVIRRNNGEETQLPELEKDKTATGDTFMFERKIEPFISEEDGTK